MNEKRKIGLGRRKKVKKGQKEINRSTKRREKDGMNNERNRKREKIRVK